MPESVRFRCNNCGHRFETDVLDKEELREARRKNRSTGSVYCPKCHRTDFRRGWD